MVDGNGQIWFLRLVAAVAVSKRRMFCCVILMDAISSICEILPNLFSLAECCSLIWSFTPYFLVLLMVRLCVMWHHSIKWCATLVLQLIESKLSKLNPGAFEVWLHLYGESHHCLCFDMGSTVECSTSIHSAIKFQVFLPKGALFLSFVYPPPKKKQN